MDTKKTGVFSYRINSVDSKNTQKGPTPWQHRELERPVGQVLSPKLAEERTIRAMEVTDLKGVIMSQRYQSNVLGPSRCVRCKLLYCRGMKSDINTYNFD